MENGTIDRETIRKTIERLETVHAWLFSQKRLAGAHSIRDAILTLTVLADERDVYRDRCLAEAKGK